MSERKRISKAMGVYWRQAAAYTYLFICLMDFVIMPVYYEWHNARLRNSELVAYAIKFKDGPTQIAALQTLKENRSWHPITLESSGLMHVSFGAILGVSAYTRRRRHDADKDTDNSTTNEDNDQ